MSYKIKKNLTTVNYEKGAGTGRIKYIVIHYFGALASAKDTCSYFKSAYRGASAHYFVDGGSTIYQCVEDKNVSWHCGGGSSGKFFGKCTNYNSIGIEVRPYKLSTKTMRAEDTDWYFDDATMENLVALTKDLMKKYDVPAERVIRHYDVTEKWCPAPFLGSATNQYYKKSGAAMWKAFQARLTGAEAETPEPALAEKPVYRVRKSWKDAASQLGAFNVLENAKALADQHKGYSVYDENGNAVYPAASYLVRVTADALNIRKGPGTNYATNGMITDGGVYTIVETKGNWGKLKSGAGWICLVYTEPF